MYITSIESPIGPLTIVSTHAGVGAISPSEMYEGPEHEPGDPHDARARLRDYFAGDVDALDALKLDMQGTAFELRVWRALRQIPYGETESYGSLAKRIGRPTAARAVGAANGRNPIMIAVPCHRVIGASGALTGYACGLPRKRFLLAHESRCRQADTPFTLQPS
jgi:methylated-DNA-[protein]-cysteine S-methyltransferase